jgi:hypothetical protein
MPAGQGRLGIALCAAASTSRGYYGLDVPPPILTSFVVENKINDARWFYFV